MKQIDIQRVRNLTTGRLHTDMTHIYDDLMFLLSLDDIRTEQLPQANHLVEPSLKRQFPDARFWDGKFDTSHTGMVEIEPLTVPEYIAAMTPFVDRVK